MLNGLLVSWFGVVAEKLNEDGAELLWVPKNEKEELFWSPKV